MSEATASFVGGDTGRAGLVPRHVDAEPFDDRGARGVIRVREGGSELLAAEAGQKLILFEQRAPGAGDLDEQALARRDGRRRRCRT
jgi:hypothetical protein